MGKVVNLRDYDNWIIRIGNVYLVAVAYEDTKMCRLSESPYNAALIKSRTLAEEIAQKVGGKAMRFNPVSGMVSAI